MVVDGDGGSLTLGSVGLGIACPVLATTGPTRDSGSSGSPVNRVTGRTLLRLQAHLSGFVAESTDRFAAKMVKVDLLQIEEIVEYNH